MYNFVPNSNQVKLCENDIIVTYITIIIYITYKSTDVVGKIFFEQLSP